MIKMRPRPQANTPDQVVFLAPWALRLPFTEHPVVRRLREQIHEARAAYESRSHVQAPFTRAEATRMAEQRKRELREGGFGYTVLSEGVLRFGIPLGIFSSVVREIGRIYREPGGFELSSYVLTLASALFMGIFVAGPLWGFFVWRGLKEVDSS